MSSARQDTVRGGIDKLAGRVLEAFGKLSGNHSAGAKGKAARGRGAVRSTKGRLKRHVGHRRGVLGGLGALVGGLLGGVLGGVAALVSGLLAGVLGLLKGVLTGVGGLLRRLV